MHPEKREKIVVSCRRHVEQMREAGEEVSFSQLCDFAFHQIRFDPERRAQNRAMAFFIARAVLGVVRNKNIRGKT